MSRRPATPCSTRHRPPLVAAWIWLALFASARGQDVKTQDPAAASLGLTAAAGSLPAWQAPDPKAMVDLSTQVRSVNPSVFIVGNPNSGYGTAFVISKEHRLLATNAHVADFLDNAGQLLAISNGTTTVFDVDKVWYHPGVIRRTSAGINIRSQSPSDGKVFPMGPDVAVLQLSGDDELPDALPLAQPDEVMDLFGKPVGMIGFPGHDTIHWPQLGEKASASYHQGVVARVSDFLNSADADPRDRQFLRHTMGSWGGFSGSPIFLAGGRVAAIHNAAGSRQSGSVIALLSYGIRIDCLWELLAYHALTDKITVPLPTADLRLARFEVEDAKLNAFDEAKDLVERGKILMQEGSHSAAGELFNEAIGKTPNYADAYFFRSKNYNEYVSVAWQSRVANAIRMGQTAEYLKYDQLALDSAQRAATLEPVNIDYLLDVTLKKQNLSFAKNIVQGIGPQPELETRAIAAKILQRPDLTAYQRGMAFTIYAGSHPLANDDLPWSTRAIVADPFEYGWYENRAATYQTLGLNAQAAADNARAAELQKAFLSHLKAWRLATSGAAAARNGQEAVRLAEEACRITEFKHWDYVSTLAAAHAEAGNSDQAIHWATEALRLAPEVKKSDQARMLRAYRNKLVWRQ